MGECNLDKIEYAELYGASTEETEECPSHWEILTRNANIPWRHEISYTGENGNYVSSRSQTGHKKLGYTFSEILRNIG